MSAQEEALKEEQKSAPFRVTSTLRCECGFEHLFVTMKAHVTLGEGNNKMRPRDKHGFMGLYVCVCLFA